MNADQALLLATRPEWILEAQGIPPDPWQRRFLRSPNKRQILNCCRQSGKSTTVAALALHEALVHAGSLTLILSPSQKQSHELFRKVIAGYRAMGQPVPPISEGMSLSKLELMNGSRIIGLPGKEGTVRGYSRVGLLIIDEASRVPDDLYKAVRPMLTVSDGRLVLMSTPFGQRGFFFKEWTGKNEWERICVTWQDCPRITREFIDAEILSTGQAWVDQEFLCLFTALEGLVYPTFEDCLTDFWPLPQGQPVGGIDWGFHNPFAALWGVHDPDGVLWIGWERYARQKTLDEHLQAIQAVAAKEKLCPDPRHVMWYADPSGPEWIARCRRHGWKVLKGFNDIRLGIAAVTARVRTGRLKVLRTACPSVVEEAQLYRYPNDQERAVAGENPVDCDNHALGALRYLIGKLDHKFIQTLRRQGYAGGDRDPGPDVAESAAGLYAADVTPPPEDETPEQTFQRLFHDPDAWQN